MTTKALQVSLGSFGVYATGYYQFEGRWYYYDATIGQWYIYSAGYIYPLKIVETYPTKPAVNIAAGDRLEITIIYSYSGPAIVGVEEYFSIGAKVLAAYWPKVHKTHSRNLPVCSAPTEFTRSETLTIPSDVKSDWTYIECKVHHGDPDVPETGIRLRDALSVVAITPDITNFSIDDYVKV